MGYLLYFALAVFLHSPFQTTRMKKVTIKGLFDVLKKSFTGFSDDKVMKLSASLAYYTVFSLAPLILLLLAVF